MDGQRPKHCRFAAAADASELEEDEDGHEAYARPPPAYCITHTDKTGTAFPLATCYLPRRSHRGLQRRLWSQLHCSYAAVKIHLQEIHGHVPQLPAIRVAKRRACIRGEHVHAGTWTNMLAEGGQGGVGVFQLPNAADPVAMKCSTLSGALPVIGLRGACGDGLWALLCAALPPTFLKHHAGGANVIHYHGMFVRNCTHTTDKEGQPLPVPRPGVDLMVSMRIMEHGDLYAAINRTHYQPDDSACEHYRMQGRVPREAGGRVLDLCQAVELAADLVEGCSLIHLLGLIHSDLKPENVFMDWGTPGGKRRMTGRLMDFGSSGVMTPGAAPKGWTFTMAYCSPQRMARISQAKLQLLAGEPAALVMHLYSVTTLDDVFAIGLMMVEILFGREQLHLLLLYPERFWSQPSVRDACEQGDEGAVVPLWQILLAGDSSPAALQHLLPARLQWLEGQGAAGQLAVMVLQLAAQCLVPEAQRLSTHQLVSKMRSLTGYVQSLPGADCALELSGSLFSKSSRYTFTVLLPKLAATKGQRLTAPHWSYDPRLARCLGDGGEGCGCELCIQRSVLLQDGWWATDCCDMWEPYYWWANNTPPELVARPSHPDLTALSRAIGTTSSSGSARGSASGIPIQHKASRNGSCAGYGTRATPSCSGASSRRQTHHRLAMTADEPAAPKLLLGPRFVHGQSHLQPPRRGYFTPELSDIESGGSTPNTKAPRQEDEDDRGRQPIVSSCVPILPLAAAAPSTLQLAAAAPTLPLAPAQLRPSCSHNPLLGPKSLLSDGAVRGDGPFDAPVPDLIGVGYSSGSGLLRQDSQLQHSGKLRAMASCVSSISLRGSNTPSGRLQGISADPALQRDPHAMLGCQWPEGMEEEVAKKLLLCPSSERSSAVTDRPTWSSGMGSFRGARGSVGAGRPQAAGRSIAAKYIMLWQVLTSCCYGRRMQLHVKYDACDDEQRLFPASHV